MHTVQVGGGILPLFTIEYGQWTIKVGHVDQTLAVLCSRFDVGSLSCCCKLISNNAIVCKPIFYINICVIHTMRPLSFSGSSWHSSAMGCVTHHSPFAQALWCSGRLSTKVSNSTLWISYSVLWYALWCYYSAFPRSKQPQTIAATLTPCHSCTMNASHAILQHDRRRCSRYLTSVLMTYCCPPDQISVQNCFWQACSHYAWL